MMWDTGFTNMSFLAGSHLNGRASCKPVSGFSPGPGLHFYLRSFLYGYTIGALPSLKPGAGEVSFEVGAIKVTLIQPVGFSFGSLL